MELLAELLESLSSKPIGGYYADSSAACEPTALSVMALAASGRREPATEAGRWLLERQARDGSVGVRVDEPQPRWPTALAVLAWNALSRFEDAAPEFAAARERAVAWMFTVEGKALERDPDIGHDPRLAAWPWVEGTHAWIEPTALCVWALRECGRGDHARTREAVAMLLDRQLPDGGCNFGNTEVLGAVLRPHIQPTGLAFVALAHAQDESGRVTRGCRYLERTISADTAIVSLSWAVLGLRAHLRRDPRWSDWISTAYRRSHARRPSPHKQALAALALQSLATESFTPQSSSQPSFAPLAHSPLANSRPSDVRR